MAGLCLLALYSWRSSSPTSLVDPAMVTVTCYLLLTTSLSLAVKQGFLSRFRLRPAVITIDIAALSLFMAFGGITTAPLCAIYYLLILHSGLHDSPQHFRLNSLLSIAGFGSVMFFGGYWNNQLYLGSGLLLGMAVMAFVLSRSQHQPQADKSSIDSAQDSQPNNGQELQNTDGDDQKTVLLITHDSSDRHKLLSYINSWGLKVDVCSSAVRAFARMLNTANRGAGYRSVVVDSLNLDMDPAQFSRSLRSDSSLHHTNLIHISPGEDNEHESKLLDAGYSRILNTPLDKTLLFDALHTTSGESSDNSKITRLINHYSSKEGIREPSDILLAISDLAEQNSVKNILEQDGQRVYSVSNGSEALDALNTHQFDMVLIDFSMPDIKGKDVIRLYYYTYPNQDWTPFIAIVDKASPEILYQCREIDVDAVLIRPLHEQKLRTTVADIATSSSKQPNHSETGILPGYSQNNAATDSSNVLNTKTLRQLEHLSHNNEFLQQLVTGFHTDMDYLLSALEEAVNDNRYPEFLDQSHALRDSSCNMGADLLHRLSLKALQINQGEFQKQAKQVLHQLHIANSKTKYALHNYVIQRDNSATET
jgi:PleD family two-component response regulator